jgi:hypothetical protein
MASTSASASTTDPAAPTPTKAKGKRPLSARHTASRPVEKKQKKKAPEKGTVRAFPCRSCVTRAMKEEGHECVNQDSMHFSTHFLLRVICSYGLDDGVACWDCSKAGRPCPTVSE